ncbi:unnamed protein product, partial [Phaeothamnion confervicola]
CATSESGLVGADRKGVVCGGKFERMDVMLRDGYDLPRDVAAHLVHNYGTRALQIAEIARSRPGYARPWDRDESLAAAASSSGGSGNSNGKGGCGGEARRLVRKYPFLDAEVAFAVEQEYALTAVDVLARRTRLAFLDAEAARQAAPRVIDLMAGLLGWSRARRRAEAAAVDEFLNTM